MLCLHIVKIKITGPNDTLGLLEFQDPRISRQSAHEGGKAFTPQEIPLFASV